MIDCSGTLTTHRAQAYFHVSVPCKCTLHVGHLTVTPSLSDCDPQLEVATTLHPINYPVFLAFGFKPHQFDSLDLANNSLQLQIPSVNEYISNFSDISSQLKD